MKPVMASEVEVVVQEERSAACFVGFSRPMHFSYRPVSSVRPSVCLSVTSRSTAKTVRDGAVVTMGETIGSHNWVTRGTYLQPPTTTPFTPNWGFTTPQPSIDRVVGFSYFLVIGLVCRLYFYLYVLYDFIASGPLEFVLCFMFSCS